MLKKKKYVILGVIYLLLSVYFFTYGLVKNDKSDFAYLFWILATLAFLFAAFNYLYIGIKKSSK